MASAIALTCYTARKVGRNPANPTIAAVHNRMPVILDRDRWDAWIDRKLQDPEVARELLEPSSSPMRLHIVSTLVNSPNNDGPELLREVGV